MAKSRAENRPTRIPVSGRRDVLTVAESDKDPNFVYRWVNDSKGNINRYLEGGYELVNDDLEIGDDNIDRPTNLASVVSKGVGGGITAYLMRIKREWYEEDRAAFATRVNESEEDMKRTLNSGKDGTYGNVSISK